MNAKEDYINTSKEGLQPTLKFDTELVQLHLINAYRGLAANCQKAFQEGGFPVIFGKQAIGKSGIIAPALLKSIHPSATGIFEVGQNWKSSLDEAMLVRPVLFVTIRSKDNISTQIENDLAEFRNKFSTIKDKKVTTIEAHFQPTVEIVKELIKAQFTKETLEALDDSWCSAELTKIVYNLPERRPLEFLLRRLLELYEETHGFRKNKARELLFLLKSKFS